MQFGLILFWRMNREPCLAKLQGFTGGILLPKLAVDKQCYIVGSTKQAPAGIKFLKLIFCLHENIIDHLN